MTNALLHIKDAAGNWQPWDGRLVAIADGTLGAVRVQVENEGKVTRDEAHDVNVAVGATADIVSHSVPVGKVHVIRGYDFTHDSSNVDKVTILQDAATKATIYTATKKAGFIADYILIDNTAGSAPVVVKIQAHNGDTLLARHVSGYILSADVTNSQAPA